MDQTPTPIYDNLVLIQLENRLEEEPPYEFNHNHTPCSETVTHRITSCAQSIMLCENAYLVKNQQLHRTDVTIMCGDRDHTIQTCWNIIPV